MRRRMMLDSEGSKPMYSGTYVATDRNITEVDFYCPGAEYFAIMMTSEPDLKTGMAFFANFTADINNNTITYAISPNAGTMISMSIRINTLAQHGNYPNIFITDTGIKMTITNLTDIKRWLQAGATYAWSAW